MDLNASHPDARTARYPLPLQEDKTDARIVCGNHAASLVDLGDGVACLVIHTKMNTIDAAVTSFLQTAIDQVKARFDALVIGNDAKHFSAGASIGMFLDAIRSKRWDVINDMEVGFQTLMTQIKVAPVPTVSCPAGLTLGGGCELTLATTMRVALAETTTGLVEAGVGLMPAGGGTKDLALRAYQLASYGEEASPLPFLRRAFRVTAMGRMSTSAHDAIAMGLYPPETTVITMNKAQQIARAKAAALTLHADGYTRKQPAHDIKAAGATGLAFFRDELQRLLASGEIAPYDVFIGERIATVLCGGDVAEGTIVSEEELTELERQFFVELCQQPQTLARLEHMLAHRQRLRN